MQLLWIDQRRIPQAGDSGASFLITFFIISTALLPPQSLFDSWLTQKEELVRSIKTSNLKDQSEMVACLRRLAVSVHNALFLLFVP